MSKSLSNMNRTILLVFIVAISLLAQSCGGTYYIFGALTKSNLYAYNPDNTYNNQGGVDWYPKTGAQIGVASTVTDASKKFSLRTEVNASYQGASYEDVSNSVQGNINLLYTYVPLIIRYKSSINIFGEAGFQPGLLLSARDQMSGSSTYFSDYIKSFDFGITGRFGYEFNDKFSIGLLGYLGFINISEARTDAKNNTVIAIRGTYTFKKHPSSKSAGK
jgi:hypothetical protein